MTVPDRLVRAFLVADPALVRKFKAKREKSPSAPRDEVWDGAYVISPAPNVEHRHFVGELIYVIRTATEGLGPIATFPGVNLSDRIEDWKSNYRIPDVAVFFLPGNEAIVRKAHVCGGPDFAVEILSEGDLARKKLDFYAKLKAREVLLIDRDPWALDLYRRSRGRMKSVGISTVENEVTLTSVVLPLTLRLVAGPERPTIELARIDGGQSWRI